MKLAGPERPAYFLYQLLWGTVDWLFPPICGGCERLGFRWCEACQGQVSKVTGPLCPCCGQPQSREEICKECQDAPPDYQALRSYGVFEGKLRAALHRLKYKRDIAMGEALSKHLIELYNHFKWDIDLVVPVPLGSQRARDRGYNQAGLLGRPLAYAVQKPYQPDALQRIRETRSQVGLSAKERRGNVAGVFRAKREQVAGKVVLVVDDVTTTGSTISACAQALREAGATAVYGLTLARAVLNTHTDDQPKPSTIKWR